MVLLVPLRYQYAAYNISDGTECSICNKPHAFSSTSGLHLTRAQSIFLALGISLPGLIKLPCRYCAPRSITLVKEVEPHTRQLVLFRICIYRLVLLLIRVINNSLIVSIH